MSPKASTEDSEPSRAKKRNAQANALRGQIARVIRIVFGVLAAILALGALLVVLRANINEDNPVVQLITDVADAISGPFSRDGGIFDFGGKNAASKNALLNWGIAAVVYLVIGRVLANLVGPKGPR